MIKQRLAIFASGTGSNALNLIEYFKKIDSIEVAFVLSNNASAPILSSAEESGVKVFCFTNEEVTDSKFLVEICKSESVDWIVLAGYLRLIPEDFISVFQNRIINLHPSLLPKYGGKGYHGRNVHKAVLANHEKVTGITIHFVNEKFDEGKIIAQFHCALDENETLESIESKIRFLEQRYLPTVVHTTIINK